jgi:hypothetical protein
LQAHGRRGSISVASRLSILPSPEKTAVIQPPPENKAFSSFAIFDDSKSTLVVSAQPASFAVFCDDEPVATTAGSSCCGVYDSNKIDSFGGEQREAFKPASCAISTNSNEKKSSSFAVFCDEPDIQQHPSVSAPPAGLSGTATSTGFAVFCDEDECTSTSAGEPVVATPHKDLNTSLASLHWSPLSCIAEESTMIDGRASLLDGSMCKGIRSVGRSGRKRRLSGTDFAYEDTEVLPSVLKFAEPYNDNERARLNRLVLGMLAKHPGMFGQSDAVFNQPFAFKATKGKAKERLKAFDCQWDVLESLGKGGFGTVCEHIPPFVLVDTHH